MIAPKNPTPKSPPPVLAWDGGTVRIVIVMDATIARTVVEVSVGPAAMGERVWQPLAQDHVGGAYARAVQVMAEEIIDQSGKRPHWDRRAGRG